MQCYKDTKLQDYRVPERFRNTQIEGKIVSFFYAGGGAIPSCDPPPRSLRFARFAPTYRNTQLKALLTRVVFTNVI